MLQLNVIQESRQAVISYPREMRKPKKIITVNNWGDVNRKWETETRDFVYSTLRAWVIYRNKALIVCNKLDGKRAHAVDRILRMLIDNQTNRLHVLCRGILAHGEDFVAMMPGKSSSNYAYACKIIAPMLSWCEMYLSGLKSK